MELWRNGGTTTTPAGNHRFLLKFIFAFSCQIRQFSINWDKQFFFYKNFPYIFTWHLKYFKHVIIKIASAKCQYIEYHYTSSKTTLLFSYISSLPLSCRSLYLHLAENGGKKTSAGNSGFWREWWLYCRFLTVPYYISLKQLLCQISEL